jgi:PAT family beta-lactamase induction signal transducer AmpG
MGFASGLPYLLMGGVLQAWLTEEGVDLATIGFLGIVTLPFSIKFLWAPFIDRFNPLGIGRRRSWLVIAQGALAVSLVILGIQQPGNGMLGVAIAAWLVALFSATQDIVIDAYRRESLSDEQQGLGASFSIYGYRLGTWLASAGGLILADLFGFRNVYFFMAGIMALMLLVSAAAPEPAHPERPKTLKAAFVDPFREFLHRHERASTAAIILAFVVAYNLGVHLSGHMMVPFYLSLGFSNTTIGTVNTVFAVGPYLGGVFLGGLLHHRLGVYRVLLAGSLVTSATIAGSIVLVHTGDSTSVLSALVTCQSIASGMSNAVFVAYIASLTNSRYTATQFAAFTALATMARSVLTTPTGWIAEQIGWVEYFTLCTLLGLVGFLLLSSFKVLFRERTAPLST